MAKRKEDNPALHIKPAEPLNLQPWGFQIWITQAGFTDSEIIKLMKER
jgi:hypothetical protein